MAEVVPARALDAAHYASWRALAADPALASPFYAPEFTQCVAQVRDDVRVAVIPAANGHAYLPFQFGGPWHRLAGVAERVGGHLSDYFGIIAPHRATFSAGDVLRHAGLSAFSFSHLPEAQHDLGLPGEQPSIGLRTALTKGWEAYWSERRANDRLFVVDTERRTRKIESTLGPLRLDFDCRKPEELTRLIEAKRTQYQKTGVEDALTHSWTRDLLALLAKTEAPQCAGLLSVLYAGDTWVAAHFGLRAGAILHHWFPVYNPELGKFSPGRLLLRLMLEAGDAQGIAVFDYGGGDQAYKREFATTEYQLFRGLWSRPGVRALGYRVAQSVAWRLKPSPAKAAPAAAS